MSLSAHRNQAGTRNHEPKPTKPTKGYSYSFGDAALLSWDVPRIKNASHQHNDHDLFGIGLKNHYLLELGGEIQFEYLCIYTVTTFKYTDF